MRRHSQLSTASLFVLFAAASTGTAGAAVPVSLGTTELGRIVSNCFYVCFGPNCSGSGTIDKIEVAPPYRIGGIRLADSDAPNPCDRTASTTPANLVLPQIVHHGVRLVWDVDVVPTAAGTFKRPLSVNGVAHFDLSVLVNPVPYCSPSLAGMCLGDDRFQVRYFWRAFDGAHGDGMTLPGNSPDSGLFYFFAEDNWEALVKVLDACGFNQRFWVFAAATTNVEYTLTVTDTESQTVKIYTNPMGKPAPAVTDTSAFATCR
jgi:hypothetical protein